MEPIAGSDQLEADVRSSTDEATHVVFDPAAIMHVIGRPELRDALQAEADRGNAFIYAPGTDGGVTFRLLFNREPSPEVVADATPLAERRRLHVPSGRLFVAGAEHIFAGPGAPAAPEDFALRSSHDGGSMRIPPGDYRLAAR